MRKLIRIPLRWIMPCMIMLCTTILFMMSGCSQKPTVKDQTITTITPTSTVIPTKIPESTKENTDESTAEDKSSLLPGLDAWEMTDAAGALNRVLTMEASVKEISKQEVNATSGEFRQYYLNEIDHFLDTDFNQKLTPDCYSVVDMDHDGSPEVIVTLSIGYDSFLLLLRYYEGNVYGYPYEFRGLELPRTNGTFLASSGALDNQIMELSFEELELKENCLGYSKSETDSVKYYVADKEVPEKEYNAFSDDFYSSEEVTWELFPSELRAGYTGEELLRVDFSAITRPVGKTLESYYSQQESETVFSHSSRIPQSLGDLIMEAMHSGTEEEAFAPLKTGEEISKEEFCKLTGLVLEETEDVIPVRIDADNDGSQDLFGLCYWGGTGGFSSMELYQGTEDGGYQLSNNAECMYQDYSFLSYQGKNYLLMKDFDYNTKYFSGYTLYLYEAGVLADGMSFRFRIEDYGMKIAYENTSFPGMDQIKNTLCNKKLADVLGNNDSVIVGTAETSEDSDSTDYRYSCDINNDGNAERYNKYMWYPSNMGTVMECFYDFEASKVLEDLCTRLADEMGEGRLYTFWLDRVGDKNVMYLYYGKNMDYTLYAYLLK